MAFLTQVAVPFIFGSIIVLNMLQSSLVARMTQPLKGVMNTIAAAAIGSFLPTVRFSHPHGDRSAALGPLGYERRSGSRTPLSVTFPFLIYHAVFFGYWPLARQAVGGYELFR